jgi:hypothetical protein
MKKIFAGIAFLGLVAFASAQTIKFDRETIDYGSIAKGSNGERQFTFTNTGDKPLIVSKVESSCGCTVPTWSKEPVAPGGTGSITVVYNTQNVGMIAKTITVLSNDPASGRSVLHIKGNVEGATTATPVETAAPATSPRSAELRPAASAQKLETRAEARRIDAQPATAAASVSAAVPATTK